jgi:ABC-2 type transport system ATP-binding protein
MTDSKGGGAMIDAHGLARRFKTKAGPVEAVRGIDLSVAPGEIVGLLGPNGAGKTTTLRMLTTLLMPSAGTAMVAGHDLVRSPREVRRRIGYVAQVGAAPSAGTVVGEELITQARLQGLSKLDARARLASVAPRLDLGGLEGRALLELSGGQRRRFDIALGLMHSPPLVFLDEPTTGLDPQSRANLWDHIRALRDDTGVTIMLTTHYLEEADALADRILVMDDGQIVADDTPDALKARISGDVISVLLPGASDDELARATSAARSALPSRQLDVSRVESGGLLEVTVDSGSLAVAPLIRALDAAGVTLGAVTVSRPTLDDVFLTLTGRSLREDAESPDPGTSDPASPDSVWAGARSAKDRS